MFLLTALWFVRYDLSADLVMVRMVADLFYCVLSLLVGRYYREFMRFA